MTLGQLQQLAIALVAEYGEGQEVLVMSDHSWLKSATGRIIGYYVYLPEEEGPVVLVYA